MLMNFIFIAIWVSCLAYLKPIFLPAFMGQPWKPFRVVFAGSLLLLLLGSVEMDMLSHHHASENSVIPIVIAGVAGLFLSLVILIITMLKENKKSGRGMFYMTAFPAYVTQRSTPRKQVTVTTETFTEATTITRRFLGIFTITTTVTPSQRVRTTTTESMPPQESDGN